jgi:hypothetical protein
MTWTFLALPTSTEDGANPVVINTDMVTYHPPMPEVHMGPLNDPNTSPIDWLRANSYDAPTYTLPMSRLQTIHATRPRAAFIALVRNSELSGMVHSIAQVEARFNSRKTHRYDWVFFNNEHFTDEFKAAVSNATSSTCYFETIPEKHWATPDWIDRSRYGVGRQYMGSIAVGKAELESYHQMCRWNAGLFALEARLQNYDWYWRVEPNVSFPLYSFDPSSLYHPNPTPFHTFYPLPTHSGPLCPLLRNFAPYSILPVAQIYLSLWSAQ